MSKHKYIFIFGLMVALSVMSCKQEKVKSGTDLMKYGIPYTIQAPADVSVQKVGSGNLADVNVKNRSGYDVQIFMSTAYTLDMTKLKQLKKEQVITHPEFSKIVEEYDSGFLFEKKNALSERSFDFSIVKIMGDKEITFEAGNSKPFNEAEVKAMVNSIIGQ
ncbi:MAG: hypothetical protein IPN86_07210 [Saprospiraceae bacterium]|jgi:hypothetical protein|nr:hypothetical protein [Saprospiraceae bacterium]